MKWIDCRDRLPEVGQRCLIFPIDGEAETADYRSDGKWHFWDYCAGIETITHWMPMPFSPIGECPRCGATFRLERITQKYCSTSCSGAYRARAYRARKKANKLEGNADAQ